MLILSLLIPYQWAGTLPKSKAVDRPGSPKPVKMKNTGARKLSRVIFIAVFHHLYHSIVHLLGLWL